MQILGSPLKVLLAVVRLVRFTVLGAAVAWAIICLITILDTSLAIGVRLRFAACLGNMRLYPP